MNRDALLVLFAVGGLSLGICPPQAWSASDTDWKGKGELGLVLARGNTTSDTLNAKAELTKTLDPWKHTVGFSLLRGSARDPVTGIDNTTGNRFEVHGQSDYKLSDRSYAFGSARYENDHFAPYDYQAVLSAGYGYKLIDSAATKLAADAGAGYRRQKDRLTGEQLGNAVFRGSVDYEQTLNASTKLYNKFLVESGSANTFLQNETGVQVSMTDRLALSLSYLLRHNSDVPAAAPPAPQLKKTDQLSTANLVFSF
ncbi:MAG TPA: DUF481 domain-containing protein [Steroidobacteraceae bacterium]|nr:DUF481 domain-containing protein [Steroidobacteraceae bacterium]